MFQTVWFASLPQLLLLYFIEAVTLIFLIRKYIKSTLYIIIILLFYPAIFFFMGKSFMNLYKITILVATLWECDKRNVFASFKKGDNWITLFFIAFSFFYAVSAFANNDSWTILVSQYSLYFIAFCLWFLVRKELSINYNRLIIIKQLTYDLILMQIIISIGKLFIFGGRQIESIVGSLSHLGGADGTILPIMGFVVLWFYKSGNLQRKDWIFVVGLMLIGFLAGKRAIWFILPLVIAAFMIYVPRLKMTRTMWIAIMMAPVAFYLGARLTPTLNPDHKVWGSFNIGYTFDYARAYQFGNKANTIDKRAQGRSGATMALWDKWISDDEFTGNDWIGIGMSKMYATDYSEFDALNLGINSKGSATGLFQTYVTTGYLGLLFTVHFFFTMLWQLNPRRIRWVLIAIAAWEYFLYTGIIFRTPAYMFLTAYFIHYSNYLYFQSPKQPIEI